MINFSLSLNLLFKCTSIIAFRIGNGFSFSFVPFKALELFKTICCLPSGLLYGYLRPGVWRIHFLTTFLYPISYLPTAPTANNLITTFAESKLVSKFLQSLSIPIKANSYWVKELSLLLQPLRHHNSLTTNSSFNENIIDGCYFVVFFQPKIPLINVSIVFTGIGLSIYVQVTSRSKYRRHLYQTSRQMFLVLIFQQ